MSESPQSHAAYPSYPSWSGHNGGIRQFLNSPHFRFRLLIAVVVLVSPCISCQMGEKQQKAAAADHAAALATMVKRNQAITDLIPLLSEWVKSDSMEGKQLRKPFPTLDELERRIGAPNTTETLAQPGRQAELMTARW